MGLFDRSPWNRAARETDEGLVYLRELVDEAKEIVDLASVQEALGSRAADFVKVVGDLEACGVSKGKLQLSGDWLNRDMVPVVLLKLNQSVITSATHPSPSRLMETMDELRKRNIEVDESELYPFAAFTMELTDQCYGMTCLMFGRATDEIIVPYRSQVAVLNRNNFKEELCNLIHEAGHVLFNYENPVIDLRSEEKKRISTELAAYAFQSTIYKALSEEEPRTRERYHVRRSLMYRVEAIRLLVNGPIDGEGAFEVNDDIKNELSKIGLYRLLDCAQGLDTPSSRH